MGFVGAGVERGELLHHRVTLGMIVIVDVPFTQANVGHGAVIEHLAFAGIGQHQKLMSVITTNRPGIGPHRNGLQPHALIGAQVTHQVAIVCMQRIFLGDVKIVAILHQEFAPPHHAETRADLIAELPLDVIQCQRKVLVRRHVAAEDICNQLFIRRTIQHVAVMPVANAQHLFAIIVIPPAFAPQIGRLQRGHQQRDMPCTHLFLMHDIFQLPQHLEAQRQPGIDPGGGLLDHPRPQHQAVRGDLGLGGGFLENGQEIAGQAHGGSNGTEIFSVPFMALAGCRQAVLR